MLPDLQVGDCVTVKRNLDHPAWMTRVAVDPRSGGNGFVRRTDLNEVIGDMAVIQRVADNFRGKTFVRLANGLLYDLSTGAQDYSGATFIELKTEVDHDHAV